jgi:uncharacterized protein (DUF2252 family)
MSDTGRCSVDEWVEVERVLLTPEERSSNLPPETAEKPLMVWVKGYAKSAAALGEEVTVETMTGRLVTGRLSDVLPGYTHTFGRPPAAITHIGRDLRRQLDEYRAGGSAGAGDPR